MSVAPPIPRLPSLNALRAFEAAARLGGFALAAEELHVTAGAVAAQIKALEDEIGAKLFERHAKGVRLTRLGQRALPGFVTAFDALGQAVGDLSREAAPWKIHIAALPALAQLWLAPRLPELRKRLPNLDVSVTALENPPNLKRVPFDICLFYNEKAPSNGVQLNRDEILPVCVPGIAKTLERPEDLVDTICLSDTSWANDWSVWAQVVMPNFDFVPQGPVFSLYSLAVQEALNGAGVLLARKSLVKSHLKSGELVAPFSASVRLSKSISLWLVPGGKSNDAVNQVMQELADVSLLGDN
jgi:LysR family transcriptional regulator, glycine cleavage system transcriptional activator